MTATPGQLTHCIAELFGVSARSIAPIDRALVDAGLRRVGGRGSSAIKVNTDDAVSSLIAVAVQGTIRTAPDRVRTYGDLPRCVIDLDRKNPIPPMPNFMALPEQHSFREALSAIIQDYAQSEHARPRHWQDMLASVKFSAPWPSAVIEFHGEDAQATFVYMCIEPDDDRGYDAGIDGEGRQADLTAEYRFTSDTLIAVADLIGGGVS
ncbi:hypothetical protein [uncultured Sulfitobacter sp.]|uniref:hypothetical protein n=1 Tax=uncultured Sulfitobacter sp. TaxID=191468 RepID=UPI0030D7939F|tara:strand:- start:17612 stop:18235 length:624 start_codon:yes stop_codon:yes gene_type:complete